MSPPETVLASMPLERAFASPPHEFCPVPWWAWTGDMRDAEMARQLRMMCEQHIHQYFLFPIYGLEVEYCSEQWWAKVRRALQITRDLGMKMWIYDEYNWPSGVCAGQVLRDHPQTLASELCWHLAEVAPGDGVEVTFRGELLRVLRLDTAPPQEVPAVAYALGNGTVRASWANADAEPARVLFIYTDLWLGRLPCVDGALWTWGQPGYIDTMAPEPTRLFIQYTHEQYARHVGQFLGDTIVGCFTDEPGISKQHLPWSPVLEESWAERFGESLRERVAELLLPVGDFRRTRQRFYTLAAELFERHYIRPQADWCEQHGLTYTGHLLWEEALRGNVLFSGDFFVAARSMHAPGLDMLESRTNYWRPPFGPSLYGGEEDVRPFAQSAKLLQSVARHAGRERVMCEAFGIFPWSQCMREQKRATDWLCALGVNLINDNSLVFSITDFRKSRIAGKHFTSPWWPHYHLFNDYAARLCLMSALGQLAAEVAILYPDSTAQALIDISAWGVVLPGGDHGRLSALQSSLWAATDSLLRLHRDYEYVFEPVLLDAACAPGELICDSAPLRHSGSPAAGGDPPRAQPRGGPSTRLRVACGTAGAILSLPKGGPCYRAVVVPCCATMPKEVIEKLAEFAEADGVVVFLDEAPSIPFSQGDSPVEAATALLALPNVHLIPSDDSAALERDLRMILEATAPPFVQVTGERSRQILTAHRLVDDRHVVFIANQSYQPAAVELQLATSAPFDVWDAETGSMATIAQRHGDKGTTVSFGLAPLEAIYLVERRERAPREQWRRPPTDAGEIMLGGNWRFRTDRPNLFVLPTSIQFDPDDRGESRRWFQDTSHSGWTQVEREHIPASVDPDTTPYYWLRAKVSVLEPVEAVDLVCDSDLFLTAYLDGQQLQSGMPTELWDAQNVGFPIGSLAPGDHWLHVKARTSPYHAAPVRGPDLVDPRRIDPIVLRGEFAVVNGALTAPMTSIKTGSWTDQGLPNFAGGGIYEQTIEVPAAQEVWLDLGEVLDLAEVYVNDERVAVRPWAPFVVDISQHVQPGANELRVVAINSLGNLLKTYYMGVVAEAWPAGLLGPCRLLVK